MDMKDKIREFLDSDLLEKYLLGTTTTEESHRVEHYIALYPEVRKIYNELQDNLEAFARTYAAKPPEGLRERIMAQIQKQKSDRNRFYRFAAAASVAILLFAGASLFFWNQNKNLQMENTVVTNKIKTLEQDMREQLEDVRNQFIVLNNPQTKTYNLNGNKKAKELKAVAYINPVKKLSYINVKQLPNLPEDQCLQMWAEVNGEMVNLGVIDKNHSYNKLTALPYGKNAVGYITIEPKGGNNSPTLNNIVANISY